MAFTTVCPNCDARLTAPDTVLGKKVKCKKCDEPFVAKRAADDVDEDERLAKPAVRSRREDDEDARPRKATKARRTADDEDDDRADEDEPRPKAKKKGNKKKKQGSPALLIALVGIGAVVLVGGGAGIYFGFIKEDKSTESAAAGDGTGSAGQKGPGGKGKTLDPIDIAWIDYSAPNGTFTAKMPSQPLVATETAQTPAGPVQADVYQAFTAEHLSMVVSAVLPGVQPGQPVPPDQVDQALEAACTAMAQHLEGAREVSRTKITYQGNSAREVVFSSPNGAGATARVFIANGRMWNLIFAGRRGTPAPATLTTFFDGFQVQ